MKTKVIHAFLWILVCMVLGITCYQCRDLRGYVILSGSMEPVIPTGSVAVVDSSKRDVRPGNIATFETVVQVSTSCTVDCFHFF